MTTNEAAERLHPVYPGGPSCNPNCPGEHSMYHDGYADGYERAEAAATSPSGECPECGAEWIMCDHLADAYRYLQARAEAEGSPAGLDVTDKAAVEDRLHHDPTARYFYELGRQMRLLRQRGER